MKFLDAAEIKTRHNLILTSCAKGQHTTIEQHIGPLGQSQLSHNPSPCSREGVEEECACVRVCVHAMGVRPPHEHTSYLRRGGVRLRGAKVECGVCAPGDAGLEQGKCGSLRGLCSCSCSCSLQGADIVLTSRAGYCEGLRSWHVTRQTEGRGTAVGHVEYATNVMRLPDCPCDVCENPSRQFT